MSISSTFLPPIGVPSRLERIPVEPGEAGMGASRRGVTEGECRDGPAFAGVLGPLASVFRGDRWMSRDPPRAACRR